MKVAVVRASWVLSPSTDVVSQSVVVVNETTGDLVLDRVLSASMDHVDFEVPEKSDVSVTVTVSDGVYVSDPTVGTFSVGDLTGPLPVTGLAFEVLGVKDLVDDEVVADDDTVDTV